MIATSASVVIFFILFFIFNLLIIHCHKLLNILGVIRNSVFAQESATVLGNQDVVLDTDTTKVLVGLEACRSSGTPCSVRWLSTRR